MNRFAILSLLMIFFGIYFGVHLYVFHRFSSYFGIARDARFYAAAICLSSLFIISTIADRYLHNKAMQIFYTVSATWLGLFFILLCLTAAFDIARLIFNLNPIIGGKLIIGAALFLLIGGLVNAYLIHVEELTITGPIQKEMRIAHITDIHIGAVHSAKYLSRIVGPVNDNNPDVVLMTGDFLDRSPDDPLLPEVLSGFDSPVYFSAGNHEIYANLDDVKKFLSTTNVIYLQNESVEFGPLQIIGIDDSEDHDQVEKVLKTIDVDDSRYKVLMYHRPQGLDAASKAGMDLMLSGHTHNGQIFPFNLIVKLVFPRITGMHAYDGTILYTGPGTGTWGPPIRLGSRNTITIITIKPEVKDGL